MSVQVKGSGTIGGLDEGLVVSGIVTASTQINVGSNIKVGSAGVVTATTFSGSGASLTNLPAGNLTGTVADARISTLTASKLTGALPAISGANLTGITQTTINSNTNNYLITGTGTANTLQGEAKLTFDGDKLYVKNSSGNAGIDLNVSNNTNPRLDFNTANVASSGLIKSEESGNGAIMEFHNKNSSGNEQQVMTLTIDRNVYVNDGNLVIGTAGHGIDFSATSDASGMSNELLEDYEEGSWTPTILGWDTFTHYSGSSYYAGWYVKVGNMVHCGWKIYYQNLSTPSSNAHIRISGLPYTAKTISAGPVCHVRFDIPDFSFSGYPVPYLAGNETTIGFYKQVSGSNNISAINATSNYSNNWTMGTATYATN